MFIAKELLRLMNDEEGLTTVEYAIAGGLVAAGVIGAFTQLGVNVDASIGALCTGLGDSAVSGTSSTNC
ncbi:pilus assembly protein [uncultured Oceanisphaera sp.]|uniref:Flp family type IVb pilin n=1 Tax=uncultured Oceanisphaera sp. TaxID=353858 RepID=UPI00263948EE|nr:pilus assembly protein [uncultured Oceanisphaera sp.]